MNDPKRLVEGDADDFERRILLSAERDRPAASGLKRTLVAMGAGASALTSAGEAAALGTSKVAAGGALSLAGWLGVGALAGVTLIVGVHLQGSKPAGPPTMALPSNAPAPEEVKKAQAPDDLPVPSVSSSTKQRVPPAQNQKIELPDPPATPSSKPRLSSELPAEVVALDQARSALRSGQPAAALHRLGSYEAQFPKGILADEALVLRVEALAMSGRTQEARALAQSYVEAHPNSAHAAALTKIAQRQPNF